MNIAHVIPYSITFPLAAHNGRYDWVLAVAQRQAQAGHVVTIYCNPASRVEGIAIRGIHNPKKESRANNLDTFKLALQDKSHEVFHSHFDNLHYEVALHTRRPIAFTQHWWPTDDTIRLAQASPPNVWAVPPTKDMYNTDVTHNIRSKGHIYHGIDLEKFQPLPSPKNNRLLFASRISPEKHLELAINVSLKSGFGLDIVGKIAAKNMEYWSGLKAFIDGEKIRYHGPVSQTDLIRYYSSAKALIFPSDITEPFGLTAIEAQACGTQVLMRRGGSRGELIEDGVTGFLCANEEAFIKAARLCSDTRTEACIDFAQRFDITIMLDAYDALYRALVR